MNLKVEVDRPRLVEIIELFESGRHSQACNAASHLRSLLAKTDAGITASVAAPVVERQEAGYVLAKQTAVEVPGQERKELGYTLFDGIGVFHSREEVHAAIAELGLPIGWVSMTVDQLLSGYMMPADSPPAPVTVKPVAWRIPVSGEWFYGTKEQCEREYAEYSSAFTAGDFEEAGVVVPEPLACLDKVKELNP